MNFAAIERDYIRSHILPDFDWVTYPSPSRINVLGKPLSESRVAIVTTCGVHTVTDAPFNLKSRTGDPSYREIPSNVPWDQLRLSHAGYNTRTVSKDINCVFPLQRLQELQEEGTIGQVNQRHFSFMGYIPITGPFLQETGPEVGQKLRTDGVDLVLLVPA